MLATPSGIVTLFRLLQPENAASMFVIPSGNTKSVTSSLFKYKFAPLCNGFDERWIN